MRLKGHRYLRVADVDPKKQKLSYSNVKSLNEQPWSSWSDDDDDDDGEDDDEKIVGKSSTQTDAKNDVASSTTINDLNDDCLMLIFDLFSVGYSINFERVCQRWKQLLRRRWSGVTTLPIRDFDFSFRTSLLTTKTLVKLMLRDQYYKTLFMPQLTCAQQLGPNN